jgi:hypothetical protein
MGMFRSSHGQAAFDVDLLPPEAPARKAARPSRADRSIVDAEFVTITETPKRSHGNNNRQARFQQAGAGRTAQLLKTMEGWLARLSVDAYSAVVALAVVAIFLLSGGFSVLPHIQAPPVVSANPLGISHVSVTPQEAGGMGVLLINGIVENNGDERRPVPSIRADLFAANGQLVASMLIEPPVNEIGAKLSHGFSAKLRHPGGKTPNVRLSFVETDVSRS